MEIITFLCKVFDQNLSLMTQIPILWRFKYMPLRLIDLNDQMAGNLLKISLYQEIKFLCQNADKYCED